MPFSSTPISMRADEGPDDAALPPKRLVPPITTAAIAWNS